MNKKTLSLVGIIVGFVFVLVGILSLSGSLGGNTSYPDTAPYLYDSGYATFGADYYTYSVNNAAEAASAARTIATNLDDIADFLKIFCGLFSMCFGAAIVCCFGIYRVGLNEAEIKVKAEAATTEANKVVAEKAEEIVAEKAEEIVTEEAEEIVAEKAEEIVAEEVATEQ